MSLDLWEAAARHFEPHTTHTWATPGQLAAALNPRTVQTPALDIIDNELVDLYNTPDGRLILTVPPQEGKSSRLRDFTIWSLTQNQDLKIVTGSYGQSLANRNGRQIRNTIRAHPELGLTIASDNRRVGEWELADRDGGVFAVGRAAGVTGRQADIIINDDPLKDRKEADSLTIRDTCWEWWTDSLSTRLSSGGRVALIMTRWHNDDLVGRLITGPDGHRWRVVNLPAQADHPPDRTDPLGRAPGEWLRSVQRRTPAQWEAIKTSVGSRTWQALYQGAPAPSTGTILKRNWWGEYNHPLWIVTDTGTHITTGFDTVIQSWDMAFKDTDQSDYVVGQVWASRGTDMYLLDQIRGRFDFPETVKQVERLTAKWPQAILKIVEDKANGTAVIATLRNRIPGIVPDNPTESKTARVNAIAPFAEAGNIHLPSPRLAPWIGAFIDEAADFPTGTHDDQVDATTQAVKRLGIIPLLGNHIVTDSDMDEEQFHIETAINPW